MSDDPNDTLTINDSVAKIIAGMTFADARRALDRIADAHRAPAEPEGSTSE